ncbi:hydroxyacid dehydrogenase [Subtercola boreus]|uniref:Hydroxyacid dehydrogenase n=2 Tax=Subtercola boreus TaxID=120213 RepID=A0A3E0VP96_9MICO|nr:hydroxyacid dehydrogenase [Subtercola boreus]
MSKDSFDLQFDDERLRRLGELAELVDPVWTDSLDTVSGSTLTDQQLSTVEVLITSWGTPRLTPELLARLPRLRAVFHCAGTVRQLVSEQFWQLGITLTTAAETNAIPVAEFTFANIVLAGKKAQFLASDARTFRADWSYLQGRGGLSNFERVVGVVGFSRVGRRVVNLLQTLDAATCLVSDPYANELDVRRAGGKMVALRELLPQVDTLTLHAPALPETAQMIGAAELALLPDFATVINTARGSLIDTAALERECVSGRLNAVLDVTDPEPLPASSRLYDLPNVIITPHVAGSLGSETLRMTDSALDELERFVAGRPQIASVSIEAMEVSA